MLSPEELLAGSVLTFEVEVPQEVLYPSVGRSGRDSGPHTVKLRPLTVRDLQLISQAAKESDTLLATLMVQQSLVEPAMSVAQASNLHVGLVQFLVHQVTRISGIDATAEQLDRARQSPLAKAAFVLAREFGWTPQQVSELTLGQALLHLQMLTRERTDT